MHQAKKSNEWHFGLKAHIGTDADSSLVHSPTSTAANVADITESEHLFHGDETEAYADACYTGVGKRPKFQGSGVVWHVADKRAKVEHPFYVVKNLFRHRKIRYRGAVKEHDATVYTVWSGQSGAGPQAKSFSKCLECA